MERGNRKASSSTTNDPEGKKFKDFFVKSEQGSSSRISKHRGTRGLGLTTNKGLEESNVGWNFEAELEQLQNGEKLVWYENPQSDIRDFEEDLEGWLKEGPVKLTIDDETTFCDEGILQDVLSNKSIFDTIDSSDMRQGVMRSNPFESIKSAFFLNRAAMKMANMDSVFEFMFTNPRKYLEDKNSSLVESDELFSFADVCAGPGGFSEYVLWKKRGMCRGFGFTLKGENDFKLHDFNAGPPEMFQAHYGKKNDGDVYDDSNRLEFQNFVMENTLNRGVHLMMADGGFSVEGQENIQEILSQRLYLCQFLVSLMVVREGGNFVCKLFDLFTPFSNGLVYLMSFCFEKITIFKPVTSRPANSERYIICQGKRKDCKAVEEYLRYVNERMGKIHPGKRDSKLAVLELVPLEHLVKDQLFYNYIRNSNNKLGDLQIMSLMKIQTFIRNKSLHDPKQTDIRGSCLKKWCIPDLHKKDLFVREHPSLRLNTLVQSSTIIYNPPSLENLGQYIKVKRDMRVLPISSVERFLLLGSGKGSVHRIPINKISEGCWDTCDQIELPKDTILDVEFVEEQRGEEGRNRRRTMTIHINDVLVWFGNNLTGHSFESRRHLISMLIKGMTKECRHDLLKYHIKNAFRLENIEEEFFAKIELGVAKGSNYVKSRLLPISDDAKRFIVPIGVCLVKVINEPWMSAWSKSQRKEYFFHTLNRTSVFETPQDAVATYPQCLKNSFIWCWSQSNTSKSFIQFLTNLDK